MRGAQPSTSRPPPAVAHVTAESQLPSDEMVELQLAVGSRWVISTFIDDHLLLSV